MIKLIFIVIIFFVILFTLPILIDNIFYQPKQPSVAQNIFNKAFERAKLKMKPLIVYTGLKTGFIINPVTLSYTKLYDDVYDFTNNNHTESVFLLSQSLEYVNKSLLKTFIRKLKTIANKDLYIISIDKDSPRILWDYKIKNIIQASSYLPDDKISWDDPSNRQKISQRIYKFIFKILPYDKISYNPINDKFIKKNLKNGLN